MKRYIVNLTGDERARLRSGYPARGPLGIQEGIDAFCAALLERSFDALAGFARPAVLHALFRGAPADAGSLEAQPETERATELLARLSDAPVPLHSVDVDLDLCVYARTPASPICPVLRWFRLPTTLALFAPDEEGGPALFLRVDHTLLAFDQQPNGPNGELFAMNQAPLASALRAWERALGALEVVDGWDADTYGFVLPDQAIGASR